MVSWCSGVGHGVPSIFSEGGRDVAGETPTTAPGTDALPAAVQLKCGASALILVGRGEIVFCSREGCIFRKSKIRSGCL